MPDEDPQTPPGLTPCQKAIDLRQLREDLIAGREVSETRLGDRMVKFVKADLTRLDRLIAEADDACAKSRGETPKRRRYAMGVRVRPY